MAPKPKSPRVNVAPQVERARHARMHTDLRTTNEVIHRVVARRGLDLRSGGSPPHLEAYTSESPFRTWRRTRAHSPDWMRTRAHRLSAHGGVLERIAFPHME
eukprot:8166937-Heterocapsa_arctica.AAC.1